MTDTSKIYSHTDVEKLKIVVNALYLSQAFLLDRIEQAEGKTAAIDARNELIEGLTYGNIDMGIMEDRRVFDFVLAVAEALPIPR
ncbi:hypothetical protein [Devosia sp. A369]